MITKFIPLFRHEDLKSMLDGNKDNVKLEAMKRIIGVSWVIFGQPTASLYCVGRTMLLKAPSDSLLLFMD
jgi:hypothetical protein